MKIVQINATYNISSTGRLCKEISDYAISKGHSVINFFNQGKEDDHSFKFGNLIDEKFHAFMSRLTGLQGYYSKCVTKKLIKQIGTFNPDVCILHNIHCNSVNFKNLFSYLKQHNIQIVLYLHDCYFFTGRCTHYSLIGCDKWKNGCKKCPQLKNDNNSWFFDTSKKTFINKQNLYTGAKIKVVGVSDWITKQSKESKLLSSFEHKRIYNWINFENFRPIDDKKLKALKTKFTGKKIILGVSNLWTKSKGLNDYIEVSKNLPKNYQIVLVGEKPKNIDSDANIYFYGNANSMEELVSLYNLADVYLNLSKQESFGLVVAESLSCGTPVVTYSTTASPELVGKGCGQIINYGLNNYSDLANKVITVCGNKRTFANACINFAKNNFDKDTNIQSLLDFIKA